jgi:glycosyltransferase involved in cell wall biosynthesis
LTSVDVVVPTTGRPSLTRLLDALVAGEAPLPGQVLLVHDGKSAEPLAVPDDPRFRVLRGSGRGPAAARNAGWRASSAEWIAFLDDDVLPAPDWLARLLDDLGGLEADVAGTQGRIRVPLPADRKPTDWERNVKGLEDARWATADLAYRRSALESVGGFDERFRRAYREDADLGLRLTAAGYRIVRGSRVVDHPPGPADRWVSVRLQAVNADDALMDALHGPGWRARAGAPRGRFSRHLAVTAAASLALTAALAGRRRVATLAAAAYLAGSAELAWARVAPGPRTREEVATIALTSALIPPAAVVYRLAGMARAFS